MISRSTSFEGARALARSHSTAFSRKPDRKLARTHNFANLTEIQKCPRWEIHVRVRSSISPLAFERKRHARAFLPNRHPASCAYLRACRLHAGAASDARIAIQRHQRSPAVNRCSSANCTPGSGNTSASPTRKSIHGRHRTVCFEWIANSGLQIGRLSQ